MITRRSVLIASTAAGLGLPRLAAAQTQPRTTTVDNPYIIANPSLALVNLQGASAKDWVEQDRAALAGVFKSNIQVTDRTTRCNVLFLYCALEASGQVAGTSSTFRDLIKGAGAHIAVLASEMSPALLQKPEFGKALQARNDWPANIVITISRNGANFGRFFQKLFAQMQQGVSMPMAWVKLAPQGPQQSSDLPGTIFIAEGGHIAFGPKKS